MVVDLSLEKVHVEARREAVSRQLVPQGNSSWKETFGMELLPRYWYLKGMWMISLGERSQTRICYYIGKEKFEK